VLIGLILAATLATTPGEAPSQADLKAHNIEIVPKATGAPGIFSVQEDGTIRHIQSGMICPADFPNVHFLSLQIYKSAAVGDDVGCDYGRSGPDGRAVSKLTIFATRAPADATLDAAFAHYKQEIVNQYPGAAEVPAALHIQVPQTGKDRTDYRATGYTVSANGVPRHTELITALWGQWVLEVRATYPSAIIMVEKDTSQQELAEKLFDIKSPYLVFMSASRSLGAVGLDP